MITKKLGARIRYLREEKGLSQEAFAFEIGMDRSYFTGIELGNRNVSIVNLEKIAKGLDVSISELFLGVD